MEVTLSIIAILLSMASLAWQTVQWRRSGPRPEAVAVVSRTGVDASVLNISVVNKGRGACELVALHLRSAREPRMAWDFANYVREVSTELPAELKGAHSFRVDVDARRLAAAMQGHNALDHDWHVELLLGDGTTRRSKGTVRLVGAIDPAHPVQVEHASTHTRVQSSTTRRPRR